MDPVALAGSELKHTDRKYFQTPPMIPWGGAVKAIRQSFNRVSSHNDVFIYN